MSQGQRKPNHKFHHELVAGVEEVLSHVMFAIGAGAQMRIERPAVKEIRARYGAKFLELALRDEFQWDDPNDRKALLAYANAVGKKARELAGDAATIDYDVCYAALKAVECTIQQHEVGTGKFCTFKWLPEQRECRDKLL